MRPLCNRRGASLILIVVLIVVIGLIAAAMVSMVSTESFTAMNQQSTTETLFVAEAGLEQAIYEYKRGTDCNALALLNNLGSGSYNATGVQYNPNPIENLSAAITNVDTVIPVVDNTNYAPHGRIQIGSELIDYTAKAGVGQLIGARRGINGTTAVAHPAGTPVLQGQCLITSTGTTPSPLPGINATQRVVESSVGYSSKQGTFTKALGVAPVVQAVAGIGFQPKAVIFFWTRQTVEGFDVDVNAGVGFANGPLGERVVSISARDDRNRSDSGRRRSESNSILFLNGAPAVQAQAELTSMDPDGFTLTWTTNNANQYIIHYIALGGDVTDAAVGTFDLTTAGGLQAVAGVGFQPDAVMFLWSFDENVDKNTKGAQLGVGFAQGPAAQGGIVYAGGDNNGSNSDKRWQQRTTDVILLLNPDIGIPNQNAIADFVSMDPDGFTVNKSDTPSNNTPIFFLAVKGGRHAVGAIDQPGLIGNQAIAGVGFQPEQMLLASFNLPANPAVLTGGGYSLGAVRHPAARGGIWFQDRSDNDPSDANMYTSTANVMTMAYGTAVGSADGPPAIDAQADFVSFDTDGFTLNWSTADPINRQILYWAIGPTIRDAKIDWLEVY